MNRARSGKKANELHTTNTKLLRQRGPTWNGKLEVLGSEESRRDMSEVEVCHATEFLLELLQQIVVQLDGAVQLPLIARLNEPAGPGLCLLQLAAVLLGELGLAESLCALSHHIVQWGQRAEET